MPINGVYRTNISAVDPKGKASQAQIAKAMTDANSEAKKSDPKNGKKAKK